MARINDALKRVGLWLKNTDNAIFTILVIFSLLPIWSIEYIPTQDGPCHLQTASIIKSYNDPGSDILRKYYTISYKFTTNTAVHFLLAFLMFFASPLVAEKLFLSMYIILTPVSMRYILSSINKKCAYLAMLSVPFLYTWIFRKGFYSMLLGIPASLFAIGYWIKYGDGFDIKRCVKFSLILLITYFIHVFSLSVVFVSISSLIAWRIFSALRDRPKDFTPDRKYIIGLFARNMAMPLAAFTPAALLAMLNSGAASQFYISVPPEGLWTEIRYLFTFVTDNVSWAGWTDITIYIFTAIIAYNIIIHIFALRLRSEWDGFALATLLSIAIFLIGNGVMTSNVSLSYFPPRAWNIYNFIPERISSYVIFMLILWFSARSHTRYFKNTLRAAAIGLSAIFISIHLADNIKSEKYLKEYMSAADHIDRHATILPLVFGVQPPAHDNIVLKQPVRVFRHLSGYIAVEKGGIDLDNYQANLPHFSATFRGVLNPFRHIGIDNGMEKYPPEVNFTAYHEKTGGYVDYVLIWMLEDEYMNDRRMGSIFEQLTQGYELIYISPNKYARLYRRKDYPKP
jgi:hypothetical protein